MKLLRQAIEFTTLTLGKLKREQRCKVDPGLATEVNLGCGLAVATRWVNIDRSSNSLVANLVAFIHRLGYRVRGANRYYPEEVYCDLLGATGSSTMILPREYSSLTLSPITHIHYILSSISFGGMRSICRRKCTAS